MSTPHPDQPRWRRTPEDRPRQILEAALAVFGEAGLAGARVEDIAERAGISKGTVYLYFPSKDDLFREVVRDTFAEILEIVESLEETDSPTADVETFCRDYWSFLRSGRFETVYRMVMAEIHAFPDLSLDYTQQVREPIKEAVRCILDRGTRSGEFTESNNLVRARMLMALLWQHSMWCARRDANPDLDGRSDDAVLGEVVTFFLEAIVEKQ
jgi:TetR/AcrR family transcriptional regulator